MGLDQLVATLTASAEADATRRLDEARGEAERRLAEVRDRVAARHDAALATRERQLQAATNQLVAREWKERQTALLVRREAVLEQIRRRAGSLLPTLLEREDCQALFGLTVERALAYIGDQPAVVRSPSQLKPVLTPILAARKDLALSTDDAPATGPIITTTDGALTVDLTLEAGLAAGWEEFRQVVNRWIEQPE